MPRRFATLDVFTERRFAGNPLAVVLDSDGLDTAAMQSVAREFNLSETVFVLKPDNARHRAKLRIFTPARELPFAGHPTVGSAVLLALEHEAAVSSQLFGLEEAIGVVSCVVALRGEATGYCRFRIPRLPEFTGDGPSPEVAARALGLAPAEIGFDLHMPSRHSAGTSLDFIPVRSLETIGRARPAGEAFAAAMGDRVFPAAYVYTREVVEGGHHFHARFFAPSFGIPEDPATGSAAAAFAGVLMQFEPLGDGEHSFKIEQGYEMGRPSLIDLQVTIREGALVGAEIGGSAVPVSEGEIRV